MPTSVMTLVSEGHAVNQLPFPPIVFGLISIAAFLLMLTVTWAFRGSAHKMSAAGHDTHAGTSLGGEPGTNVVHDGHH